MVCPPSISKRHCLSIPPSSLLFYLAVKGDWVSRSELAFLYKPDETETEALTYLRLQLHRAQQFSWASTLEIEKNQVRWCIDSDVAAFNEAIKVQDWQEATNLYKNSFFAKHSFRDLPTYSAWIDLERDSLEQAYRLALSKQLERFEQQSHFEQAADLSAKLLALDELDETALQIHLRHLALAGQKDAALKRFASFSKLLSEDLDSEPLQETLELIEQVKQDHRIDLKTAKEIKHNLPSQSTRFIGRKAELAELSKQLSQPECRLLSLIGLGGAGKSRLSLELARAQIYHFPDGVFFVALASLETEDEIVSSLAQMLGLQLHLKDAPLAQLLSYLKGKHILLVFDNFEHLLGHVSILNELLKVSDKLKLIVTSRESLKLNSEWLFDVSGLNYATDFAVTALNAETIAKLEASEAVGLFVSAAKRVSPQLEPSPDDLLSIAQIAKQVEGLPLALELAASWVRIMPISRIAKELGQGYDLLKTDLSDIPERHRSLNQILDKTWATLSKKKDKL